MAGMNVTARGTGFLAKGGGDKYKEASNKAIRVAFNKAMTDTVKVVKNEGRNLITRYFPKSKSSFKDTWQVKRFNRNRNKFETAVIYNKVKWFSLYETGGTINGKLVIPLYKTFKKMTTKQWKSKLKSLKNSRKSFFKKIKGDILLFEIIEKNHAIPIGVVINKVSVKKRYAFSKRLKEVAEKNLVKSFERHLDLSNI